MHTSISRLLLLLVGCSGCMTSGGTGGVGGTGAAGSQQARPELESTRIEACEPFGRNWELPGNAQTIEVFRNNGRWVLVYESMMRSGPRTVWQPLRADLAFDGDGIVVGLKNLPIISDFRVQQDGARGSWITYRAKQPGSELYSSFVELLPAQGGKASDALLRVRIPTNARESIQEAWLMPSPVAGHASVVVRVNPFSESGAEQTVFRWYGVTPSKNTAKLLGEYRATSEALSSTRFVALSKTLEPVAFAVVSRNQDFEAADARYQKSTFRIAAKRIFSRTREEVILYESAAPLANLAIETGTRLAGGALLAWIQEPTGGANTLVQWSGMKFEATEAGFAALKRAALRLAPKSLEVTRDPARLRIRTLRTGVVAIAWWTAADDDNGYLVTPVAPQPAELSMADGYDANGRPRRRTRPVTSGVYASERNGRILGVAEGAGPNGADVLLMSRSMPPGGKSMESVTTISSCAIRARQD